MRATWLVLGGVVALGTAAYVHLIGRAGEEAPSDARTPSLERRDGPTPAPGSDPGAGGVLSTDPAPDPAAEERQALAETLVAQLEEAEARRDREAHATTFATLQEEAWDEEAARAYALEMGERMLVDARRLEGIDRMRRLDRARRLISRGLTLPALFTPDGRDTAKRQALIADIQEANAEVMTFDRRLEGGLPGVTRPFQVPPGWVPVMIVSREKLRYGHNGLLYWNHDGNLDPRRLRAGEVLLLPEGRLRLEVDTRRYRLAVYIDDWFVCEYAVGVGRPDSPTPLGTFRVGSKHENPTWWKPGGGAVAPGPENELGRVWIELTSDRYAGAGYGIHGTNKPATVGSRCSNGCVRLEDDEAFEVFWWVRTASAGGEATEVVIR